MSDLPNTDLGNAPVGVPPTPEQVAQIKTVLGLLPSDLVAAINSHLGSEAWQGDGTMTAANIVDVLDAYLGGTNWRETLSAENIVAAIDGYLGGTEWQGGGGGGGGSTAGLRPYAVNSLFQNSGYWTDTDPLKAVNSGMGSGTAKGLADGIREIFIDSDAFAIPIYAIDNFGFEPLPVSLVTVTFASDSFIDGFISFVDTLNECPTLINSPYDGNPKLLDASLLSWYSNADLGTNSFLDPGRHGVLQTLYNNGWTILTPGNNAPDSPWINVSSSYNTEAGGYWYRSGGEAELLPAGLWRAATDSSTAEDFTQIATVDQPGEAFPMRGVDDQSVYFTNWGNYFGSGHLFSIHYQP